MAKGDNKRNGFDQIPFRIHPRVFAALGADLVTSDIVAVIELVKNSYDAFAGNVWLRFLEDGSGNKILEIEDDGQGMTRDIIEHVWCTVATPYKANNPIVTKDKRTRRVSGDKGLGRLAAARLGSSIEIITQAPDSPCWHIMVDWDLLSQGEDISDSFANLGTFTGKIPFKKTGTVLRILDMKNEWDADRILELQDNLGRLLSPFCGFDDFKILVQKQGEDETEQAEVELPEFLTVPKYCIRGTVDQEGKIDCEYLFAPISKGSPRKETIQHTWAQTCTDIFRRTGKMPSHEKANCGAFAFDIRGWDMDAEGLEEIKEKFDFEKKKMIRDHIRAHKGVSVYRDDVLVLPKSEKSVDWMGLDLRRVSKVGVRMSTSQLMGYASITAEENSKLRDTSDREHLVSNPALHDFVELLITIVSLLEGQRQLDKSENESEQPINDLFGNLSAADVIEEISFMADEDATAQETIPVLKKFQKSLEKTRKTLETRFVYYSRLATVGTIAHMLIHEIRGRTMAFGRFIEVAKQRFGPFKETSILRPFNSANEAVHSLERLADTFNPLASRAFRSRKRKALLEERIQECLYLQDGEIKRIKPKLNVPKGETNLAVDPGVLDAILLNLLSNSLYWLTQVPVEDREILIEIDLEDKEGRVKICIHDSGPGIKDEDFEKVLLPGMTRKPDGIGMGLTVVSELVAEYGGSLAVVHPGQIGGATFCFDLPLRK